MRKKILCLAILACCMNILAVNAQEFLLERDVLNVGSQPEINKVKVLKSSPYVLFSACDWLVATQNEDGSIQIETKANKGFLPRTAMVILTSKKTNYSKVLKVEQETGRSKVIVPPVGANRAFLGDMNLSNAESAWIPKPVKDISAGQNTLTLKGSKYVMGVGTHAPSRFKVILNGAKRFHAVMGIDDEVWLSGDTQRYGNVDYQIYLDSILVRSGNLLMTQDQPQTVDLDLAGAKEMLIVIKEGDVNYGDHVDLCNAYFEYQGKKPEMGILTDKKR